MCHAQATAENFDEIFKKGP